LISLNLSSNLLGPECGTLLENVLVNMGLEELDLSNNKMGD
jgi:hypothetical protein